ncbi:unnamed protein product [Paramecium primaurelia]|uniref:Transmembrane protein n=1 Tax=Paramecium primaurelia TaxID=5886 RepID=A0A8S1PUE7_PARPR|nr:unnamed protein product [Paramecium primaurelia]
MSLILNQINKDNVKLEKDCSITMGKLVKQQFDILKLQKNDASLEIIMLQKWQLKLKMFLKMDAKLIIQIFWILFEMIYIQLFIKIRYD